MCACQIANKKLPGSLPEALSFESSTEPRENIPNDKVEDAEENNQICRILDKGGEYETGVRFLLYMAFFDIDIMVYIPIAHRKRLLFVGWPHGLAGAFLPMITQSAFGMKRWKK